MCFHHEPPFFSLLQDTWPAGEGGPRYSQAEMVAAKRSLRPGQACGNPAWRPCPETTQLRGSLLHLSCRAAAGLPGGCSGVLVERPTLPAGTAQRGDPPGGQTTANPCPPRPGLYSHCHTLLYGSRLHWRKPRFSRAPVHPAIGVPTRTYRIPFALVLPKRKQEGRVEGEGVVIY